MNSASGPNEPVQVTLAPTLRVGEFTVFADSNEISRDFDAVRVRPLIMQLLLRLAKTPGVAISREQLIDEVWSRKIVNDEVLSRAIAELRTALADDSKVPRYIETLPKIGYRLIAAVNWTDPSGPIVAPVASIAIVDSPPVVTSTPPAANARRAPGAATIAVLVIGGVVFAIGINFLRVRDEEPTTQKLNRQINAATAFASDPAAELSPRFSADGKKVIYLRRTAQSNQLVIHDMRTGDRRVAHETPGILASPLFFPDGRRIAYWRRSSDDCEIVEHDLVTNAQRQLLNCALSPQSRFDIAPDGSRMVFTSQVREYPGKLMLMDIGSRQVTVVTQPRPGEGDDTFPRFSPDGVRIAFFRGSESHQRAWIVDGSPPYAAKPVTTVEGLSYGLAWMGPQGPLLVAADWFGFRALNWLDLQSSETRLLGGRGGRFPDVGLDGSIVFESATYRADLWLTDTQDPGKRRQVLWPSTRYSSQPEFSPDGLRVVFASNREGADGIFVGVLGGEARRIPLPEGFRYIRPHWTPDGRSVLAVRIPATRSGVSEQQAVHIDIESGRNEILTKAGNAVNSVHALGKGTLLVGELADYAMRLSLVATGKDEKTRLALPLVAEYAVSGNTLVYTLPQLTGATRCELDSMRCTPLKIELNDDNRFDWTLARDAIWYLGRNPDGVRVLRRHDLATGKVVSHDFAPSGAGNSLAVSPDGKQMIVLREEQPVIDLMLARKTSD